MTAGSPGRSCWPWWRASARTVWAGWWTKSASAAGGDPAGLGPLGGLYWLMTVVLPGYACFRYPAKLLVVAALGAECAGLARL